MTSEIITLWTFQLPDAYERFCKTGVLRGDGRRIDRFYRDHYRWYLAQMEQRLSISLASFPVWAWQTKPDMRERSPLWLYGVPKVRLELRVPCHSVLLSDWEAWDLVFGGGCFLPENKQDWDEFHTREDESEDLNDPELLKVCEQSWTRIFELDWRRRLDFEIGSCSRNVMHVQATIPEIRLDQVVSVKHYRKG